MAQGRHRSPRRASPKMLPTCSKYTRKSLGSGARTSTQAPVEGCENPILAACKKFLSRRGRLRAPGAKAARRAVERVPHHGMPDGRKVRADLVRAPGMQGGLDQRAAVQARDDAPVGARVPALGGARGHARAASRIARNGQRDRAGIARHFSVHKRHINFSDVARAKLFGEIFVRSVVARHHHRAGSFTVQAMHDARTQRAARLGEFSQAVQQRVHQRALARGPRRHGPPSRRACSQSRNRRPRITNRAANLPERLQRRPWQDFDLDGFSGRDPVGNLGNTAVHADVAFARQFLDARPAKFRNVFCDKQIQPPAGVARSGCEGLRGSGAGFSLRVFLWSVQCRESFACVNLTLVRRKWHRHSACAVLRTSRTARI